MKSRKVGRREAMAVMGAASAAVALGCGDSPASPSSTTTSTTTPTTGTNAACAATPTETVGPFPSLVHTSGAYASRGTNPMSNASDGIFADSLSSEIVTPSASPTSGYSVTFQVGI